MYFLKVLSVSCGGSPLSVCSDWGKTDSSFSLSPAPCLVQGFLLAHWHSRSVRFTC